MAANRRVVVQQPALPRYRIPFFRELSRKLRGQLRVTYGSLRDGPPDAPAEGFLAEKSPIRVLSWPTRLYWHSAQLSFATRQHCELLALNWNTRFLSLIPALLKARKRNLPVLLWGHGYSKRENVARLALRRFAGRLATGIVLYDSVTADGYVGSGFPRDRVFVAPNALDQEPIEEAKSLWLSKPQELADFRRTSGLNEGPVLLFASRLVPENRLDLLLQAVSLLSSTWKDLSLVVIGAGPAASELRRLSQGMGTESRVRFVGELYDEELLAPWFLSADLFCYPENLGLSLLHAFGYGVPVVACGDRRAHNPEIHALRPGFNGATFERGDARSLAFEIDRTLRQPRALATMQENALWTVREKYTLSRMVEGMLKAIDYCASTGRRAGHL